MRSTPKCRYNDWTPASLDGYNLFQFSATNFIFYHIAFHLFRDVTWNMTKFKGDIRDEVSGLMAW